MTYEEILERLKEIGNNELEIAQRMVKKELKELPNVMYEGETIEYLTSGTYDNNTWLIACTDKRILFLDKGMFFGCKQLEIPLEKINSIEATKGLFSGAITVWDGSGSMKIEILMKSSLQPFVAAVNRRREALKQPFMHNVKVEEKKEEDFIVQLERLAVLRDKGIVTEEEFQAKKKQILGL